MAASRGVFIRKWPKHSKHPAIRGPWDKRGSGTPGKTKGWNCKASNADKIYARLSRAYRNPTTRNGYAQWAKRGQKIQGTSLVGR